MQFMFFMVELFGVLNLFDFVQNVDGGMKYLKQMFMKYDGNVFLVLVVYNVGFGNVDWYGGVLLFKEIQ